MRDVVYSVVSPVYNSAESLEELVQEIVQTMEKIGKAYEIILVDDCSLDDSWEVIKRLKKDHSQLIGISLAENSGQIAATTCGIHHSRGDVIITIDDDLQYPPTEIRKLTDYFELHDFDMVFGYPSKRGHSAVHNFMVMIGKFIFHQLVMRKYKKVNFYTTFRIIRRTSFLNRAKPQHLFFFWDTPATRMSAVPVLHTKRKHNQSTYSIPKLFKHYAPQLLYSIKKMSLITTIVNTLMLVVVITLYLTKLLDSKVTVLLFVVFLTLSVISYLVVASKLEKQRTVAFEVRKVI